MGDLMDPGNMDWDSIVCGWAVIGIGCAGSYAAYQFGEYPGWVIVAAFMMLLTICVALWMNKE